MLGAQLGHMRGLPMRFRFPLLRQPVVVALGGVGLFQFGSEDADLLAGVVAGCSGPVEVPA